MTAHTSSASGFTRYSTLAVAVIAVIAIAGSVWANGNGQQAGAAPGNARIDISGLLSSTEIANLPVLHVEQPF